MQDDNMPTAELIFMLVSETLMKETRSDSDLIEVQNCIEDDNHQRIPESYRIVAKQTHTLLGSFDGR